MVDQLLGDQVVLEAGDIILQIGDFPLDAQTTFSEALFNYEPGDTVTLRVLSGDGEREIQITFDARTDDL